MGRLDGKVALITGGARGMGKSHVRHFVAEGARVVFGDVLDDRGKYVAAGIGEQSCRYLHHDVTSEDDWAAAVALAQDAFGRLDVLVNNAAITFAGDIDLAMKRWDLVMEVNLRAPVLAIKAALPGMIARRRGAILNVSSAASMMAVPGLLVYGVSKAGLERLTTGVAEDVRARGVAVNCFRIDVPIASEGFVYNAPELDKSDWEPSEVGAEGALWMLAQPPEFTGQVLGITDLRRRHGVAQSRVQR